METVIGELNGYLNGWVMYFRCARGPKALDATG
jgi:hypothetical protein